MYQSAHMLSLVQGKRDVVAAILHDEQAVLSNHVLEAKEVYRPAGTILSD
jgi:hypothetical protein